MRSVRKYDFFWRLDSVGVEYHCDIKFDPFVYLQERNMVYSFTVALHEYSETVPTLWNVTREYVPMFAPAAAWRKGQANTSPPGLASSDT
jgi:hypothetical protein